MTKTRDLADLGGGFIQAGTGAVQRTVESKLQDVVSVLDFIPENEHAAIKAGTSTYNATAAIQAAMTYAALVGAEVFVPAGIYMVSATLTCSVQIRGQGRSKSVLKHDGSSFTGLLDMTSNVNSNIRDIGFEGSGVTLTHYLVKYTNGTTRNINIYNCAFGRYAVNGHGAEIGLWLAGDNYHYRVQDCLFDYNKFNAWISSSNGLGPGFQNCRLEHASGYGCVVLENGHIKASDCAFQFNSGACIISKPDSVDEANKQIGGNTATGVAACYDCTFERNNRGQWQYFMDGTYGLIGYVTILNGAADIDEGFFTGATAGGFTENGQAVLVSAGSASVTNCGCSASVIATFLRGGSALTDVTLYGNSTSGGAITSQYNLNNTNVEIKTGELTRIFPSLYGGREYTVTVDYGKRLSYADDTVSNNVMATLRIDLIPNARSSFTASVLSQAYYVAYGGAPCTSFTIEFSYYYNSASVNYNIVNTFGNAPTVDLTNVTTTGGYILVTFTTTRSASGTSAKNAHFIDVSGDFGAVSLY